jgi:hypothetical protein
LSIAMTRYFALAAACLACSTLASGQLPNQKTEPRFIAFSVPGSPATYATGINDAMTVTGTYVGFQKVELGFVRTADGRITSFKVCGKTYPLLINSSGEIAGVCKQGDDSVYGFVRSSDGHITSFSMGSGESTYVTAMNDGGTVVGFLKKPNTSRPVHGFLRHPDGFVSDIDVPGSLETRPESINRFGEVTGVYLARGGYAGFIRYPDGQIATFSLGLDLLPSSINTSGYVAGVYIELPELNPNHGFVRSPGGKLTTFTPPGRIGAEFLGINDEGTICGNYEIAPFTPHVSRHSFIRTVDGGIHPFDFEKGWQTVATGINNAGVVAGYAYEASGPGEHSFLRIPGDTF